MVLERIKKFLWPNRGILGVFLVWTIFILLGLVTSAAVLQNWDVILLVLVINLVIVYLFSCLSVWAYEKFKRKKR